MRVTLLALCLATASLVLSACSSSPLDAERFQALLSPGDVADALGVVVDDGEALDAGQLLDLEANAVDAYAVEQRFGITYASSEDRGVALHIWAFRTDRHARERLNAMVYRDGLSPTEERVGSRSAEGLGSDGASTGQAQWAVLAFQKRRLTVVLQASAPAGAEGYQGALRELAALVDDRL